MKKIAKFMRVSKEQFLKDWMDSVPNANEEQAMEVYERISLPKRATSGSAGYDFFTPLQINLQAGETVKIPTGIRARIEHGWVLLLYPRSGLGFKYRLQLDNTVGIIDSDYFSSDNEGHIFIKLTNDSKSNKRMTVEVGTGFAQGIFMEFGLTEDDSTDAVRNGGFGSTTKA